MTITLAACSERPARAEIDPMLTAYYEELKPRLGLVEIHRELMIAAAR